MNNIFVSISKLRMAYRLVLNGAEEKYSCLNTHYYSSNINHSQA
jgi:hypothetical protein